MDPFHHILWPALYVCALAWLLVDSIRYSYRKDLVMKDSTGRIVRRIRGNGWSRV